MKRNILTMLYSSDIVPTPAHEIPCVKPDCVLPWCVNQKLQTMDSTIKSAKNQARAKLKYRGGFKNHQPVVQDMEMELMTVVAENNWDQDLADILNILGADACENSAGHLSCPAQKSSDPKRINPKVLRSRKEPQNQPLSLFQSTDPSLHRKVTSHGSVFPVNDHVVVGDTDRNDLARIVPNGTITVNNTDFNGKPNPCNNSYGMDSTRLPNIEASSCGAKRSTENQGRHKPESSFTIMGRKPRNPQKNANQLFGILSLILEAFAGPLTSELEEHYICALQKALSEIENIRHKFLQQSHWKQTSP